MTNVHDSYNGKSLPKTWIKTSIGEISEVIGGGTPSANDPENFASAGTEIAWLTPADLSGYTEKYIGRGARDLSQKGYNSSSAKLIPAGSLLFSSRAPIGYVAIASNDVCTSQGFKNFVFPKGIDSNYAYYFLLSIRGLAESVGTGTTFKEISGTTAKTLPFFLPPLAEQKVIADKLDSLLAKVKFTKDHLSHIPDILKYFRQLLLVAAISGKLTEEWRGSTTRNNWKKGILKDFIKKPSYGTSNKSQKEGLMPVLRMGNLQNGNLDWSDLVYTSDRKDIEKYKLIAGDILFNRTNSPELVGKTSIYKGEREAIYAGYLIKIQCLDELNPEYLNYHLNSPIAKQYYLEVKSDGVNQSNINAQKIAAYPLEVPPIEEQIEIVRRVEELLSSIDSIQTKANTALSRVNNLTQAILVKAFSGELTADWRIANPHLISGENSAESLLKKIKLESESLKKQPRTRIVKSKKESITMTNKIINVLEESKDWITAQDAFYFCGVTDNTKTERIEELYAELRELDKTGRLQIDTVSDEQGRKLYDRLKLVGI